MNDGIFVSTDWLGERLGAPDIVVVDGSWYLPVHQRDANAEYREGHIPGAVRIDIDALRDENSTLPHMLPQPAAFAKAVGALGIGDGMTIVVYDGLGLFSAPRVRWMFRTMGARDVRILEGGMPKWQNEGRPTESGMPAPKARTFTARLDNAAVASFDDVKRALGNGTAQVVDARPADRFRGDAPEPRPGVASGHIPGSANLPFSALVSEGALKSPGELKAALDAAGVDSSRPIITSCGSGVTAAVVSLALETIGQPAKALYDGAWADWGTRDGADVAKGE